jgi:hypothetical protein
VSGGGANEAADPCSTPNAPRFGHRAHRRRRLGALHTLGGQLNTVARDYN